MFRNLTENGGVALGSTPLDNWVRSQAPCLSGILKEIRRSAHKNEQIRGL